CHRARRHGRRAGAGCGADRDAVVRLGLAGLQKVGGALMLPIAVLPIAGLLLRLGQPDLLDSASVAAAGAAIFSNLGLLFAIGVAVGLARENHGAAGLASVVAYLVATRGAEVLIAVPPDAVADLSGRASGLAGLLLAGAFGTQWQHLEAGMDVLSRSVLHAGAFGLFAYGVLNRVLIVTGLHHIINNIAWFILGDYHGVTGDLKRFFAGD